MLLGDESSPATGLDWLGAHDKQAVREAVHERRIAGIT
jgi:hypothetical protein